MTFHHARSARLIAAVLAIGFVVVAAQRSVAVDVAPDRPVDLHYLGLSTEIDFTADFNEPVRSFLRNRYLGFGVSYGYGRGWFRPRARLNVGVLDWSRFYPTLGLELPLIETLSAGGAKLFGVYVTADAGWAFGGEPTFVYRLTQLVRVPLGPFEGVGVGASYRSDARWSVFIGRIVGGYPRL